MYLLRQRHIQKIAAVIYISIIISFGFIFLFLIPVLLNKWGEGPKMDRAPRWTSLIKLLLNVAGLHAFYHCCALYRILYLNYMGRLLFLLYLACIHLDNTKHLTAINGNGLMFLRHSFWTTFLRNYFPVKLIKTAELQPNRNYVLANFPHGIFCTGITINMAINIKTWLQLYPGVRPKIATLGIFFYIPIIREIYKLWGIITCSQETLTYYLSKSNDAKHKDNKDGFTSNAVAVVVGGSQEVLDSHPGRYTLTLKNRKGFVKIAINTGSAIVPSFIFGEVDIYEQVENPPNSLLRKFQQGFKNLTGMPPAIVFGRGFLPNSFGLLPQRKPIVQVVGAPIDVKKLSNPSPEYIDEIHQKVIESVIELFEKYKHDYIENADKVKLIIN